MSSGSCGMQRSGISDALVCSWPPPIPTPGSARSSHISLTGQQASQYSPLQSPDDKTLSRAPLLEPTSTAWSPSESLQTELTTTVTKPTRATGWKSENMLQPIRSRTNSMPSVRRPPGELWRSESRQARADHEPVDATDSLAYSAPPGLSPHRPELRRSGSHSDLLPHGSVSLSLALGSQPLRASDHTKAVPPIGAERSRVVSITALKAHIRNSPSTKSHDLSPSPWRSSPLPPRPQAKWENELHFLNNTPSENVQANTDNTTVSKEDLGRLLRHAVRNKHAPKIVSPLSPLRTAPSATGLSADPRYQQRMPSQWNHPSPRYSSYLPRRIRTYVTPLSLTLAVPPDLTVRLRLLYRICDGYQPLDWNATCVHCQECKRDSVGKRLLAFRYCQQQTQHFRVQRSRLLAYPSPPRGMTMTPSAVDDDRLVLANRIREAFAYEMDEEEKSLWDEVAAVTGAGPISFSRVGARCGVATHQRVVCDGSDDGSDDHLNNPDDNLLMNESATLFRDVSVY